MNDITDTRFAVIGLLPKTRSFKNAVDTENLRLNNILAIDIMYIGLAPVLHVVGEAKHFISALL